MTLTLYSVFELEVEAVKSGSRDRARESEWNHGDEGISESERKADLQSQLAR